LRVRLGCGTGGVIYALLRVAITINLSGSVDSATPVGSRSLFPTLYAAMMRAGSIVMLTETIGSIAAESGSTLGPTIIVSGRPVNLNLVMIDIAVTPR
jgi:hypothetical protein